MDHFYASSNQTSTIFHFDSEESRLRWINGQQWARFTIERQQVDPDIRAQYGDASPSVEDLEARLDEQYRKVAALETEARAVRDDIARLIAKIVERRS
jgi:hypothetical protein